MSNKEGNTHLRRRGAVAIENSTVYDSTISYSALGVLAILLARPDDAPRGYRTLVRKDARVGQAAILSAFRELREGGYRYQFLRTVKVNGHNKVVTDTYVSGEPISLEVAKQWHFEATGQVAIDVPDRRKSKGTLASVRDAHERDAHERDAHAPDAQTKAFPGSAQNREQIKSLGDTPESGTQEALEAATTAQGEVDPVAAVAAWRAAQEVPAPPADTGRDDAAPKLERGPGYEEYLELKRRTRATVGPGHTGKRKRIKEVAPLRPNTGAGAP